LSDEPRIADRADFCVLLGFRKVPVSWSELAPPRLTTRRRLIRTVLNFREAVGTGDPMAYMSMKESEKEQQLISTTVDKRRQRWTSNYTLNDSFGNKITASKVRASC